MEGGGRLQEAKRTNQQLPALSMAAGILGEFESCDGSTARFKGVEGGCCPLLYCSDVDFLNVGLSPCLGREPHTWWLVTDWFTTKRINVHA